MEENNLQKYANIIISNIDEEIENITIFKKNFDVKKIFKMFTNLSNSEQDIVFGLCVNDYLNKIKNYSLSLSQLKKLNRKSDDIIDCITYSGYEELMEEASVVCDDLIMKVSGYNGREINLPLDIDIIKKYCIHSIVNEKDIKKTLIYILINLSSICYFLDKNSFEN